MAILNLEEHGLLAIELLSNVSSPGSMGDPQRPQWQCDGPLNHSKQASSRWWCHSHIIEDESMQSFALSWRNANVQIYIHVALVEGVAHINFRHAESGHWSNRSMHSLKWSFIMPIIYQELTAAFKVPGHCPEDIRSKVPPCTLIITS